MYPVNQVILGGDSMFNSNLDDLDVQIQRMEAYRQKLKQLKEKRSNMSWLYVIRPWNYWSPTPCQIKTR